MRALATPDRIAHTIRCPPDSRGVSVGTRIKARTTRTASRNAGDAHRGSDTRALGTVHTDCAAKSDATAHAHDRVRYQSDVSHGRTPMHLGSCRGGERTPDIIRRAPTGRRQPSSGSRPICQAAAKGEGLGCPPVKRAAKRLAPRIDPLAQERSRQGVLAGYAGDSPPSRQRCHLSQRLVSRTYRNASK